MQDYTLRGVPVAQCSTHELEECLRIGVEVKDGPKTQDTINKILKTNRPGVIY